MIKWSMFNLFIDDKESYIIRNTLNTTTVRLGKKFKEKIDQTLTHLDFEDIFNLKDPTGEVEKIIQILLNKGILINSNVNEKELYKDLFSEYRQKDTTLSIYIATTTNCQLACPYCFEGNEKKKEIITIEEADKIVGWTLKYIIDNNCDKLRVVLYGGEPLLNKKVILYILPKLKETDDMLKISFETGILTNGEFLDLKMGKFLSRYNLTKVQITLDGPKKCHDARRFRKITQKGTFDAILKNILSLMENNIIPKIDLRINFDKQNVQHIPNLFDIFVSKGLKDKINLSFGIITSSVCGEAKEYYKENSLGQEHNGNNYLWLCREAQKRGFTIPKEFLAGPWCVARKIHSVVILPKGGMIKCISLVGMDNLLFGNINDRDNLIDANFINFQYIEDCLNDNCPFVPICGGGCRFESYVHNGNFSKPYCQKILIKTINEGLVKLNYK